MNDITLNMDALIEGTKDVIRKRISKRIPIKFIADNIVKQFYIAGNSLNKDNPNDIDIFPIDKVKFNIENEFFTNLQGKKESITIISETKNAITTHIYCDNQTYTVQFCNYFHNSLKDLVDSFDFSHVQVGAEIISGKSIRESQIYFTEAYMKSKLSQSTEFVGSKYPLSSLLRTFKYEKRGDFAGKSYMISVFRIVEAIIRRGFNNYNDFKEQLDSVDLGLVPEQLDELTRNDLINLFEVLRKDVSTITADRKSILLDCVSTLIKRLETIKETNPEIALDSDISMAKNVIKNFFE
jgi:hypothetical protein